MTEIKGNNYMYYVGIIHLVHKTIPAYISYAGIPPV